MGQHKLANRVSLLTRWIICTVWSIPDFNATSIAEKAYEALPSAMKEITKAPETVYKYFWTPIGTQGGIPVSFATENAALDGLKDIVNREPNLMKQNLKFSLLEVKYAPNKVRAYKQNWHDKYVIKDIELELKGHKFTDKIQ